jgi:N-acyl amino acid synthase FeeM
LRITRLAVDRAAAGKRVLAGLFHTAYLFACKIHGYTHAVIEVNPRHVLFYGKELKFKVVGPERLDLRVNAPAMLLCVSFQAIAEGLTKHAGKHAPAGTKRTLFHYGFPPKEELGVLHRLSQLVAQDWRFQ